MKSNIIDLTKRLGKQAKSRLSEDNSKELMARGKTSPSAKIKAKTGVTGVHDITAIRQEIIKDERREVRRTILTGFIGAFVVLPQKGLMRVEIYDISEDGIAFDLEAGNGHFEVGEEVAMRVYMSQEVYFPFTCKVQNFRALEGEGSYRHGGKFVKGAVNDEALYHFVKFIETVSASLERDSGDVMVSNLKK